MGINVTAENNRANSLKAQVSNIRIAINQLEAYKADLSANWIGEEVKYVLQSIDSAISKLKASITAIDGLSSKITSLASSIKREEDEAAERLARQKREEEERQRAAQAQRQRNQRIAEAQSNYDSAKSKYDAIKKQYNSYKKKYNNTPLFLRWAMDGELNRLANELKKAETNLKNCERALNAARQ